MKIPSTQIPHQMLSQDAFSQWLGIEIVAVQLGYCKVKMNVRKEMLNSMQKAHGGITYALADTAFGFAANTHGSYAVSIETSINHIEAVNEGDELVAESTVSINKNKLAFHVVEVKRGSDVVALFKGVVYKTSTHWMQDEV